MLNGQSITLPHNKPHRSLEFVQKQPPEVFCRKRRLQCRCFHVKFAKVLRTPILQNSCKRLLVFALLQNTIANSSGEFKLDETSTARKVSIIRSNAAVSFICKLKNVSLTFQLTFSLKF